MLTKKEVLKSTIRVFTKLKDNLKLQKKDIKETDKYLHRCACCQYAYEQHYHISPLTTYCDMHSKPGNFHFEFDCQKYCPMISCWPKGCEDEDSPYLLWHKFSYCWDTHKIKQTNKDSIKRALQTIIDTAQELLDKETK